MAQQDRRILIQRSLDGELEAGADRGVEALLIGNPDLAAEAQRLEQLHESCSDLLAPSDPDHRHERVMAIMETLPEATPARARALRGRDLVLTAALVLCVWMVFGLLAGMPGLVPLSQITVISLAVGAMLLILAEPLRQAEAGLLARLLRRSLPVAAADVMVVRLTGLAIILGVIWYRILAGG